jgi:hypothetical protein
MREHGRILNDHASHQTGGGNPREYLQGSLGRPRACHAGPAHSLTVSDVGIANPVTSSPFLEPTRFFEFGDRGIAGTVFEGKRRECSYFVPIAHGRRQTAQLTLEAEWTKDRLRANDLVNRIRDRVAAWRKGHCLPRHHADHCAAPELLERARPLPQALLLPDRSARDRRLPRRGGRQGRRCTRR